MQSICQQLVQQWVRNLDRQLPMVAYQPGYLPALTMPVPTRPAPRPVDEDRLLLLEAVGIQLDPDLWYQMVTAR